MTQLVFAFEQDAIDAARYWRDREFKVFAIDVLAGPDRRPTHRVTFYSRARSAERAIDAVKRDAPLPKRPRFHARLAGPRELGCTTVPAQEAGGG